MLNPPCPPPSCSGNTTYYRLQALKFLHVCLAALLNLRLAEDDPNRLPGGVEIGILAPGQPAPSPAAVPPAGGGGEQGSGASGAGGVRTVSAEEAVERMLEALMSRERAPPSIISSPVKVWGKCGCMLFWGCTADNEVSLSRPPALASFLPYPPSPPPSLCSKWTWVSRPRLSWGRSASSSSRCCRQS